MKKLLVVLAVAVLVVLAASPAMALVAGSRHDLSAPAYYSGALLSACQYCHTPHRAVAGAPLWNRTLPTKTYTLYGGGNTLAGTAVNQPGTNSLTCLSCHDGTIAVSTVVVGAGGVVTGPALTGQMISSVEGNIGTSLADDHPVGVQYIAATAGLRALGGAGANTRVILLDNTKRWQVYGAAGGPYRVECGSCHDPHQTGAGQDPFLKGTVLTICTDCHNAK